MLPSLFIAHGSPLLAIENNAYTEFLNRLSGRYALPKAVVIFSAHWESRVQKIGDVEAYEMIYDFGGFPDELYRIRYPARGSRATVEAIEEQFALEGIAYEKDGRRGLDHGAWVVLRLLYPQADVPVVSMSVNPNLIPEEHYRIGQALAPLRERDILVIGSGGTVHNLAGLNRRNTGVESWAVQFDDWLADCLEHWDLHALFDYERRAPFAHEAVPWMGNEHFIPLLYAMGAADRAQASKLLHRSYVYGSLSQSCWQFG
ncbi:DODA-type extradiol aromatic ring-opening family dioxygenase [Ferviditalea candida]|uniref:Class III extradiol ring-cleavage dioxygenase n=1 Tax=Ferviditalea candida TaxID=3108399 RepID=A0ABU5ZLJ2_9BACL|nr:class III extradiol ring-cleavage dioxygenase [Paenibacillaceae bacterium T2]